MVVDDHGPVDLLRRVELGQAVRDRLRVVVGGAVGEPRPRLVDLVAAEGERAASLPADGEPAHVLALGAETPLEHKCSAEDLGIERARQATVAGERDDRDGLHLALLEQCEPAE